ncbi:MAG: radical SAM family heme chaperone HemW [Phycisphaerae bacterium]|nr:radical SAM family heme chaperone HemW [Phycisphaerae bacterium]
MNEIIRPKQVPGLYVHVPFCARKCKYCSFYSEPIAGFDSCALVDASVAEMDRYSRIGEIKTAYIGGGSPSCLGSGELEKLVLSIVEKWPCPEEFTIEFNPSQVGGHDLEKLLSLGVSRISIGGQSFVESELEVLGRDHSAGTIENAVKAAKEAGFGNISVDLIFGIPGSSIESFECSLRRAIGLGVEHISAYSLSYEKGTFLQNALEAGEVRAVDEQVERRMYERAIEILKDAGFGQYEISNFAKPGFECCHNHIYWANGDYIGIGPSATSYIGGVRSTNIGDIGKYISLIAENKSASVSSERVSTVERACQSAVLNLRRRRGIIIEEFKKSTGFAPLELFADAIETHVKSGLLEVNSYAIFLRTEALFISDSVLCDFAAI